MTREDEDIKTLQGYTGWGVEKCREFLRSKISTQKVQIDARLLQEVLPKLSELSLLRSGVVELTMSIPYQDLHKFMDILKEVAKDNGRKFLEGPEKSTDLKLN